MHHHATHSFYGSLVSNFHFSSCGVSNQNWVISLLALLLGWLSDSCCSWNSCCYPTPASLLSPRIETDLLERQLKKKNPSNEMAEQQEKCQTTWFLCECDCQYVANIIGIGIGIGWSLATCSFFFALLEGWNISCPCGCSCSRVAVVYYGWRMKWS